MNQKNDPLSILKASYVYMNFFFQSNPIGVIKKKQKKNFWLF